jgi:hypothetical protein
MIQEAFNQGICEAGQAMVPLDANVPDFLKGQDRMSAVYPVGMAPEVPGLQMAWVGIFIQEGSKEGG